MYWNARLNAAGKQCGFWNSDPQHGQSAGKLLSWQIADRKYRLALRAAATKSASRSWRTYTSI
jgi:hypothetical protein